jgi:DNA polymerase epsilon subunit 3
MNSRVRPYPSISSHPDHAQVYRDNSKGDKGRKSGAASSSHKAKARDSESASTVSKPKGKEKEKATNLPPPFTFAPRAAASSASLADVHSTEVAHTEVAQEVVEEMGEPGEEDEDDDDEGDDEGDVEEEVDAVEPIDLMAIEEEEQRRDVAGLEEPGDPPAQD